MDRVEGARVIASAMTVSDKIRALSIAGYPRAEIARALGKRYQHVRNVLEGDKLRGPSPTQLPAGVAEASTPFADICRLVVEPDGSVRLPHEVQALLGARPGGVLIAEIEEDRLIILSGRAAWKKIQVALAPYADPTRSIVDELIAERHSGEMWGD
ncbi:AbrB/MazE/SpoVT family DNA-binding domain-containing protein [Phenylobacterium sp.]|uniref:AbrB/MazE/SpoVT family DNA-binding domain-containing protein n=1 Tax=Phenylobacterium sp. TaxID=1871053 RepID=UPI0025EDF9C0|nr:AbrB/MazE/SpoVT family DNA-binding domain-containing protein [Phenylobacterium sp.]